MQISGNHNKNNAKVMKISTRAAQVVHGERGSRKIPDSHNKGRQMSETVECSRFPTPARTVKPNIPGNHNSELGAY